ncbi:MAG: hypothetical protein KF724_13105 [Phycisphaeraceae bacterium]|nr:hypothetical protein [Phycisphaeraceae bacterium]
MHGISGLTRPRTSRVTTMSACQRRSELAAIIASGIARAIAARAEPPQQSEDPAVDGLALSAGLRLSVPLAGPPVRIGPKAGEHA